MSAVERAAQVTQGVGTVMLALAFMALALVVLGVAAPTRMPWLVITGWLIAVVALWGYQRRGWGR